MMQTANIKIGINGEEFDAEVSFTYTPEVPAVVHLIPENCYPGEPEEIEITGIKVFSQQTYDSGKRLFADLDDLVFLIEDSLVGDIKEYLEGQKDQGEN